MSNFSLTPPDNETLARAALPQAKIAIVKALEPFMDELGEACTVRLFCAGGRVYLNIIWQDSTIAHASGLIHDDGRIEIGADLVEAEQLGEVLLTCCWDGVRCTFQFALERALRDLG